MTAAGPGCRLRSLALALVVALGAVAALALGPLPAAATAGNVSAAPNPATTGCTVDLAATAGTPGRDLTFAIDGDNDGEVAADEHAGTVTSNATTGEGAVTVTLREAVDAGGRDYTVYAIEEATADGADDTSYPVSAPASFFDATVTLGVPDATSPSIANYTVTNPRGRVVAVSFESSEALCAVEAAVGGTETGTLGTADFTAGGAGPYTYNATYFPATAGRYTVTLTAAVDGSGNDGTGNQSGTVVAGTASRNRDEVLRLPATVYLGEEALDLSPAFGTGRVTLIGTSGAAAGLAVTADPASVDVSAAAGFAPGGYNRSGGDDVDLTVEEPAVSGLTVVTGPATGDVEVTDGIAPLDRVLTVSATFNFAAAEPVEITIVGPRGVDVTPTLVGSRTIADTGKSVTLDVPAADLDPGRYSVTVEAASLNASRTATVTLLSRESTLSLDRTRVTRGRDVRAAAFGEPGGTAVVRVDGDDLRAGLSPSNATSVFRDTGDVTARTGNGTGYVGAELDLGRDGIGVAVIRTATLAADRTVDVDLVDGTIGNLTDKPADAVPLRVDERTVELVGAPDAIAIGEAFTIEGRAPRSESVAAYARVGGTWEPLYSDASAGTWAGSDVDANGAFAVEVEARGPLAVPDGYRVAVVADPDYDIQGVVDGGDPSTHADDTLSRSAMAAQVAADVRIRTAAGGLDATLSRDRIAATGGDAVVLSGSAVGQGDAVMAFRVGPRGTVDAVEVDVQDGRFDHEYDGFGSRGRHRFLVVGPGRDGAFAEADPAAATAAVPASATPDQALSVLRDRYGGPGIDDVVLERTLVAEDPRIVVRTVSSNRSDGNLTVSASGSTNREGGTAVSVELVGPDGAALAGATSIADEDGGWTATVSAADADPGTLTLRAFDGEAAAEAAVDSGPTGTVTAGALARERTVTRSSVHSAAGTEATLRPVGTPTAARGAGSPVVDRGSPTVTATPGPAEVPAGLGLPVLGGLAGALVAAAAWRARGRS